MKFTIGAQGVIAFLVAIFALIGWRRGTKRELVVLAGAVLASALTSTQLEFLKLWVNRFHKIGVFVLNGGLTEELDTAGLFPAKPLVETGNDAACLAVITFCVVIILSYGLGQIVMRGSPERSEKALGGLIGGVNGFLISRFTYPRVFPAARTHVAILSGQVSDSLTGGSLFSLVLVGLVMILIIHGVRGSSHSSQKGN